MASLHRKSGGTYHISFRFAGRQFYRSLGTASLKSAKQQKAVIERTIQHLNDGVYDLGATVSTEQLWQFVRTGGKAMNLPSVRSSVPLEKACYEYLNSFGGQSKEASTLATEQKHTNHLTRILGRLTLVDQIHAADVRRYVAVRESESGQHGRNVRPVTIRKELQTLRQLWDFCQVEGWVSGINPVSLVRKPRGDQKPPFMAWEEIQQRINRGGLTEGQIAELWECLFLRENEIAELLRHVKSRCGATQRFRYIYAALCFCAYTGARRSEMFRCQRDDVNGRVTIREKKRSQKRGITLRDVPLHPELERVLHEWLNDHPGGQFLFCKTNGNPLDDKTSREAFDAVTKRSRWEVLRGYHVLRHSFASNLARHGVDQRQIDQMMGHQTEDMRARYQHLFPEDQTNAITLLSYGTE